MRHGPCQRRGIVHRDLKPQNVMFRAPSGRPAEARSDLYSPEAILCEMATGRRLIGDAAPADPRSRLARDDALRLPARLAGDEPLRDRPLAERPAQRFRSARERFATIAV